jgi:cytochrome c oxidase assembly protein subunit 15
MPAATASLPTADRGRGSAAAPALAWWLVGVAAMIFAMVVIGGITRLTESGLSIAEWRPVTGWLPPLDGAEWERLFALYRAIPEFQQLNPDMTLAGFKTIFWWEYVHRLWGRLIGLAFALPLGWFLLTRRVPRRLLPQLLVMLGLGAAQGALGWYMVASGLALRTDVSQYRLVAHLLLALAIYGYILWVALGLFGARALPPVAAALRAPLLGLLLLLALTVALGGFTAGLNGGLVYNSFPLMGGSFAPADLWTLEPAWRNFFEDPAAAQFAHRWLAVATVLATLALWLLAGRGRRSPPLHALASMALLQGGLGLATLLFVVPIPLAALHQAGAVLLLSLLIWALRATGNPG